MAKTIAQLESSLAFWQNLRFTTEDAYLRKFAHESTQRVAAELRAARKQEQEVTVVTCVRCNMVNPSAYCPACDMVSYQDAWSNEEQRAARKQEREK